MNHLWNTMKDFDPEILLERMKEVSLKKQKH